MATNNMSIQRIKREFKEVLKSEEITQCSIKLEIVNDNFTELKGEIAGPPDTPYEGGTFKLEVSERPWPMEFLPKIVFFCSCTDQSPWNVPV